MIEKEASLLQIIRKFCEPIKYAKKYWITNLSTEIFDAFQSVFSVQVGVFIIHAIEIKSVKTIIFRGCILIIIRLLGYFFEWLRDYVKSPVEGYMHLGLRTKYFGEYIKMDNTFVEKTGTGKIQNIIFDGINNRVTLLNTTILAIIVEIGAIIYAFVIILQQAPTVFHFLGLIVLLIGSTFFMRIGLKKLQSTRKKSKEISLELVRRDIKIIMSKFEILQNGKLGREMEKTKEDLEKQIRLWQNGNNIKVLRQSISSALIDGLQIYIYIAVGIGVIYGEYTFAYMMLMLQLLNIVSKYIRNIRNYLKDFYRSSIHLEKLWEIFDTTEIIETNKGDKFSYKKGNIEITDMNFGYGKSSVFQSFSLNIQGGTKTAFVGESGGGKTTLIKLLAGYIKPDQGEIKIDGQKLSEIKLTDYYKHIGYLTQDPSVFDGTIKENLVYALDKEPKKSKLEEVIKLAKCEFIRDFKKGLETEIGERGVRLSGGQKQRLAIAKIMLKNPNIILLDEPTSALDSFNEELINIALHNLFKGKTVIVVAHRLQTVKQADRILLLEQGKILEDGTHSELVKMNKQYKKMLDLQSGF